MKKFMLFLIIFSSGLLANAHTLPEAKIPAYDLSPDPNQYQLVIAIEQEGFLQQVHLGFKTENDLRDFNSFSFAEEMLPKEAANTLCSVSITVKIRVGVGSNFVEASATASGIACSDVVSAIRRLRQGLAEAIK